MLTTNEVRGDLWLGLWWEKCFHYEQELSRLRWRQLPTGVEIVSSSLSPMMESVKT